MSSRQESHPRLTSSAHPYIVGAELRLKDARRAGTLGKLARAKTPKEPKHWAVTCGGYAYEERFQADQRYDAVDHFRDLGWRGRSVPGVQRRRWFCPGCQSDQDWSMMFAFASPVLAHLSQEELESRTLWQWPDGNPRFLRSTSSSDGRDSGRS